MIENALNIIATKIQDIVDEEKLVAWEIAIIIYWALIKLRVADLVNVSHNKQETEMFRAFLL